MNYAQLAARAASLEAALRKIMEAHRFNVAGMAVTEVHSVCFYAVQPAELNPPQTFLEYALDLMDGPVNRYEPGQPIPMAVSANYSPPPDYRARYEEALEAVTAAGYEGISPSEAIRAQFENISDLEASAQALEDEVGPLLTDLKEWGAEVNDEVLKAISVGGEVELALLADGYSKVWPPLLARIEKVLK